MKKNLIKRIRLYGLLLGFVLLCGVAITEGRNQVTYAQEAICLSSKEAFLEAVFSDMPEARAYYVYNITTGDVLFDTSATVPLPLASLTKLMSVRVAYLYGPSMYSITEDSLAPLGDTGFIAGEQYLRDDLIRAALIASSNDAAEVLAGGDIGLLTKEASRLGLHSLSFKGATGLDDSYTFPTALGSARDIVRLMHKNMQDFPALMSSSVLLRESISPLSSTKTLTLTNTNTALPLLEGSVASKTGYTLAAGGNLAMLFDLPNGDRIGAVVLGSTEKGRFDAMIQVYKKVTDYYNLRPYLCDFFEE